MSELNSKHYSRPSVSIKGSDESSTVWHVQRTLGAACSAAQMTLCPKSLEFVHVARTRRVTLLILHDLFTMSCRKWRSESKSPMIEPLGSMPAKISILGAPCTLLHPRRCAASRNRSACDLTTSNVPSTMSRRPGQGTVRKRLWNELRAKF